MVISSPKGQKTLLEKEKLLFTSNFSFSNSVFKRLEQQTHKGLDWEKVNDRNSKGFRKYYENADEQHFFSSLENFQQFPSF